MRLTPRSLAIGICTAIVIVLIYSLQSDNISDQSETKLSPLILASRREEVLDAFDHAWKGYSTYCFGNDTIHPVSNTCDNDFGGWGATAIDTLSTAIMFGREDVVKQILRFVATLDFKLVRQGERIQLFEVAIRHLGGMISAGDLLNGPFSSMVKNRKMRQSLYDQMQSLGDALSCGFDTPTRIPRNWVDPKQCKSDNALTNTVAGVGTLILEFARLSNVTGNPKYAQLAEAAEGYLLTPSPELGEPFPGLLGSFVDVETGQIVGSQGSWGALSDSYYEYLIKAYVYNSAKYQLFLDHWLVVAESTIKYLASHPFGHPEWTLIPYWEGTDTINKMDSLSWFVGGNLIYGGMVTGKTRFIDFGLSIADTAGAIYNMTLTGLGGEYVSWETACNSKDHCDAKTSVEITDGRFRLRPEVLETWYYAYRATGNQKYREWAWNAFQAMGKHCKTESGFSAINDVNKLDGGGKADVQESFVFAEVFKYLYMIHLEDDVPYHVQDSRTGIKNEWVFNTEAHPFRVAGPPV